MAFGYYLAKELRSHLIVKTKNNCDDVNFDEKSEYRDKIKYLISAVGVKYIVDIHGMKKSRDCDINLGINLGSNIKADVCLYDKLQNKLKNAGFIVSVDEPFKASSRTIAGYFAKEYDVWTIQIEINCGITNESKNNEKANLLLNTLVDVLKKISR